MTLNEICEFIVDCPHSTAKDEGKGFPLIRTPNIGKGRLILEGVHRVSKEVYDKRNARAIPQDDDLILAREAPAGNVAIIKNGEKVCLGQRTVLIRPDKNKVYPDFLAYYILAPEQQYELLGSANGATVAHVNIPVIKALPVILPEMERQKKVAGILKTYDDLIENNQKQIMLLEEAAQRLYKEWFVNLHFPGYEDMQIVDGVPEGWKIVSLDDVISKITTGLNPRKNFVLGKGNNFYVTIKNMGDNNIYLDDKCDKIDNEALEKINKRSDLRTGDILFSGIGTMGRVYLISIPTNNWNVSESVFTMRANERITNEYLYMVLLSDDMKSYCDQNAHGVAQRGIRMADLRAYKLLLPDDNILKKYTYISKPLIQKVQALQKQCKELTEARDRLLPKLMSGEIEL